MPTKPTRLGEQRPALRRSQKRQSSLPPRVAKLYSTAAWTRRSRAQRDAEPLCRACKAVGRITAATVADHIDPATYEDSFWNGELQSLCDEHHQAKRQAESRGETWRPVYGCDAKGMPLDPDHHWNR